MCEQLAQQAYTDILRELEDNANNDDLINDKVEKVSKDEDSKEEEDDYDS